MNNNPYWSDKGYLNHDQAEFICNILKMTHPEYILEIGFATGRSASTILTNTAPKKFVSIDNDLNYRDWGGREVANRLMKNFKNFKVVESRSQEILVEDFFRSEFPKGINLAFIDGDHCFEACMADLMNIYPYLASKGCILVDDYKAGKPHGTYMPSVIRAVDSFSKKNNIGKIRWNKSGKGFAILAPDRDFLLGCAKMDYVLSGFKRIVSDLIYLVKH